MSCNLCLFSVMFVFMHSFLYVRVGGVSGLIHSIPLFMCVSVLHLGGVLDGLIDIVGLFHYHSSLRDNC